MVPVEREPIEGWSYLHTPEDFRGALRALRSRGWRFVPLDQLAVTIRRRGVEPRKTVAVTFDDGWLDNYQYAFPILQAENVPAAFFLSGAHWREGRDDPKRVTRDQMLEMLKNGMSIGGHTRSHPNLAQLPRAEAWEEIAGNKAELEQAFGLPVKAFAYPFGAFNREAARLVRKAGYGLACSAGGGANNTRLDLYWLYRETLQGDQDSVCERLATDSLRRLGIALKRAVRRQLAWSLKPLWQKSRPS